MLIRRATTRRDRAPMGRDSEQFSDERSIPRRTPAGSLSTRASARRLGLDVDGRVRRLRRDCRQIGRAVREVSQLVRPSPMPPRQAFSINATSLSRIAPNDDRERFRELALQVSCQRPRARRIVSRVEQHAPSVRQRDELQPVGPSHRREFAMMASAVAG
jgi:hypothetical protein